MPTPPAESLPPSLIRWSGLTHPGKVRPNNEDAFLALTVDGHDVHRLGKFGELPLRNSDFVFAVSDGMGGAHSGEFASRIAVQKITRLLPRAYRLSAAGLEAGFNDVLRDVCRSPGILCRDLAAAVPPRAEYFYDDMHLSEAGARLVAQLVVGWVLELPLPLRPAGGPRS